MAAPSPAIILPAEIQHYSLALHTKPGAAIQYTFAQTGALKPPYFLIFLNGLMSDKSSWLQTMTGIIRVKPDFPPMLAYDRYGQGLTEDRDPQDTGREEGYGHDVKDVASDLRQLVRQVCKKHSLESIAGPQLILVANSIGCAVARVFTQENPGLVVGIVLLDSIIANSNFDFWPDPDAEGFDASQLPDDVNIDVLKHQRAKFKAIFSPDTKNKEGLDRRSLATLLPDSDKPKLIGPQGQGPLIRVIGHDFETFASESLRTMGTPLSLSMRYSNPAWHEYNIGLTRLTHPERAKGPIIATGCGHFIQRDDPGFVEHQVSQLLKDLEEAQTWD